MGPNRHSGSRVREEPASPSRSDADLIAAALGGQQMAFALLMERSQSVLKAYLWGKTPSDVDLEDILQETFVAAYRNLGQVRQRQRVGPWLITIARNQFNDAMRRRARHLHAVESPDAKRGSSAAALRTPEEVASGREFMEGTRAAIGDLPDKYRLVVAMRLLDECSLVEIAHKLDVSESTARVRLHRGLKQLRSKLRHRGNE